MKPENVSVIYMKVGGRWTTEREREREEARRGVDEGVGIVKTLSFGEQQSENKQRGFYNLISLLGRNKRKRKRERRRKLSVEGREKSEKDDA